jgi:PKD repeat protein
MKKIYSLLIVLIALVSTQSLAQSSTPCDPQFTYQYLTGASIKFNPLPVSTADSPYVQHYWNFGDASIASNLVSPTHTYTNVGGYYVKHYKIKRNANNVTICTDSAIQYIVIQQAACNLYAGFGNNNPDPSNALIVQYINYSYGYTAGDSLKWTFYNGTTSTALSPTFTYPTAGIYNVCLRVKKPQTAGSAVCVSEICMLDTITIPNNNCNVQAFYTSTTDSLQQGLFHFANQSLGYLPTDSVFWNFGDGSPIIINVNNPNHIYANAGFYNACITIKRNTTPGTPACVREYCKQIVIAPPCNLLANFTYYRDSLVTIPNSYHFTNTTTPLASSDSIRWTFGDGTSSNQVNPNHAYTIAGIYNVCLRVIKRNPNGVLTNCISEKCYTVIVAPPIIPCNIQVYFSSVADSLQPNIIHFTNQTIGYATGDSLTWYFGDGTFSHDLNPTHVYAFAGTYTVCLIVKKNNTSAGSTPCIREYCKTIVVTLPCTLIANFYTYRDSITTIPNAYHFINTSVPLASTDSIRWTFGDGTSSNQVNPNHSYTTAGTYNVCLRVIKRNPNGVLTNCISEKCYTLIVPQLCNINASYTWQADISNYKRVNFNNTTTAPTAATALWNFGDGTTATTWNVAHIYAQAGRYYVCLRIQYGNCVSYKCDTINVIEPPFVVPCRDLAKFSSATYGNGQAGFAVFYPQNNVQYTWTFGDGTGAQTGLFASHTYATSGTFTACLTAYKDSNCASTSCKNIYVAPFCNNITLGINDTRDSLVPNRITFTAVSNTATTSQQWTITRILVAGSGTTTINTNNPTYMFLDSGYYNVCVKATYANGCVKTICKVIHVLQNMPTANNCTLQITPNPASSVINANITLVQPLLLNAYVYNSMNVLVAQKQQQGLVGNNTISMNIAALPAGIYILRLVYGTQLCYATFVKQ